MSLQEEFELLEKHKKSMVVFLSAFELNKNACIATEEISLFDFQQGEIRNCTLIAALASMSQRPEFLNEIAPTIDHTKDGVKLHFSMYYKGEALTVTIDDKLPFIKQNFFARLFGINPSLIYARSYKNKNFY